MRIEKISGYDTPTMSVFPARSQGIQESSSMRFWHWITLALIVALSTLLNFFQLQAGAPYSFYAVAVHSMLLSWKNFFFLSYDPNGFVSVDKPPLDLWLQAASAKLFLLFTKQDSETTWRLSPKQRQLVRYLQAHRGHTRFLVAMINAYPTWWSSSVMLATSEPVMALGGFKGTDPILTVQHLRHLIADGTIRFFWLPAIYQFHMNKSGTFSHSPHLVPNGKSVLSSFGRNSTLIKWVNNHCSPVRATKRDTMTLASYNSKEGLSDQLFDCSHTHSI